MRSPEMLLAASSPATQQNAGSGHAASDVWALGCLLYELVMGTVLFPNELDWPKFFITVTDPTQVQAKCKYGSQYMTIGSGLLCACFPEKADMSQIFHSIFTPQSCTLQAGSTFPGVAFMLVSKFCCR